jgi:DNA-binding LytR/AlgR family response regulator
MFVLAIASHFSLCYTEEKEVFPMLRIAICDDLPEASAKTEQILRQWPGMPEHWQLHTFSDGDSLIAAHTASPFDIIFLDVVMPLLNGIDTAREIRHADRSVKIVFLTSSAEFAVESYKVKADNYLLKPTSAPALYRCLEELYRKIQDKDRCITVKSTAAAHRIPFQDIEYVESQNKQVLFSLVEGTNLFSTEPLYSLEKKLLYSDGFYKCHRSYIVNLHRIKTYSQKEIQMRSGCRIPISRSCHKEFEAAYFEFLFGKAEDV